MVKRKMARDYEFRIDDRDFKKKMKKLQADFPDFTKVILGRLGLRLMAKVKLLTPVDTGLLKRSWFLSPPKITPLNSSIELKNNVKYGLAQEYGARGREGRFMLRKGFAEFEPQAPQILETEIQQFINRHGGGH